MPIRLKTKKLFSNFFTFAMSSTQSLVITIETIFGIFACFFSLFIFLYFTDEMLDTEFHAVDIALSQLVYAIRTPILTDFMIFITDLSYDAPLIIVSLIIIILLIKKHRKEAALFCITFIIGIVLNVSLKSLIQRPRPELSPLVIESSYSFPSGHAMNSFIFFALLSYFSFHFFRNKKLTIFISIASFFSVLLIGFSRVYLGVHYPTDILAGYVAGFWWFITVLLIDRTLIFYKLFKQSE